MRGYHDIMLHHDDWPGFKGYSDILPRVPHSVFHALLSCVCIIGSPTWRSPVTSDQVNMDA